MLLPSECRVRAPCTVLVLVVSLCSPGSGADVSSTDATELAAAAADPTPAAVAALAKVLVWRTAEGTDEYPLAGEYTLRGGERVDGTDRAGASGMGTLPSGKQVRIALVQNDDLYDFISRQSLLYLRPLEMQDVATTCTGGRYLLNDPRVGLFHNQRISYEVAVQLASVLRRTLVMPGFFKFPHPDAYDGTQWVPVRRLFDFSSLQRCYRDVVQLDEFLDQCGSELLDNHVTVPFQTTWMRSPVKAPWINETRPELKWDYFGGSHPITLRPRETRPEKPIQLDEPFWYLLHGFLEAGVADAQTVRVHGLIAADLDTRGTRKDDRVCFLPAGDIMQTARRLEDRIDLDVVGGSKTLGVHLRVFKRSMTTTGGYMRPEVADKQLRLCNFEPEVFIPFVAYTFKEKFPGFWPTHTYLASNEADHETLKLYIAGFPGPRMNPYTPGHFNEAVTAEDSLDALSSILVDAVMCSTAQYFIGNSCSTMSQYIGQLRAFFKKPVNSSMYLGGTQQAALMDRYRSMIANKEVFFMRSDYDPG